MNHEVHLSSGTMSSVSRRTRQVRADFIDATEREQTVRSEFQTLIESDSAYLRSLDIALHIFDDHKDKSGRPLIQHSLDVSTGAFRKARIDYDIPFIRARTIAIKALLHDVIEDSPDEPTRRDVIRSIRKIGFDNTDIRDMHNLTREKDEPYFSYIPRTARTEDTRISKLADLEKNAEFEGNKFRLRKGTLGPGNKYAASHDFLELVQNVGFDPTRGMGPFFLETDLGRSYLVPENRDMLTEGFGGAEKIPEILRQIESPPSLLGSESLLTRLMSRIWHPPHG